jgi:hypothetical protein
MMSWQPVLPVVAEPGGRVGAPAEQHVQGAGVEVAEPLVVLFGEAVGHLPPYRLFEPGCGLAGWCGQRDPGATPAGDLGLLREQSQQASDGGGFAGARATGEDRRPLPGRGLCGSPLFVVRTTWEEPVEPCDQCSFIGDLWRRLCGAAAKVVLDLLLFAPVAIEVQTRVIEAQWMWSGEQGASGDCCEPFVQDGPGQLVAVIADFVADLGEVEADGSGPDGSGYQCTGECH